MTWPTTFDSDSALASWLISTDAGREILEASMPAYLLDHTHWMELWIRKEVDYRLMGRASVLIVCHEGGWMEAFSDDAIVRFADLLAGSDRTLTDREAYLQMGLPKRYASLLGRTPVAVHGYSRRTVAEEICRRNDLEELFLIREMAGHERKTIEFESSKE